MNVNVSFSDKENSILLSSSRPDSQIVGKVLQEEAAKSRSPATLMEITTKADFLRLSTDFLLSLTPQIFHEKWKNENWVIHSIDDTRVRFYHYSWNFSMHPRQNPTLSANPCDSHLAE
jgi:hypothetical protein